MKKLILFVAGLLALVFPIAAHAQCEPTWLYGPDQSYPGVNQGIIAMTVYDDGSGAGPALYAGGSLTIAGDAQINNIGRWDGASWQPLADGLDGKVLCLTAYDGLLIAGGRFTSPADPTIRNIAAWDGAAWHPLAEGMPYDVMALTLYKGHLYAGATRPGSEGPPEGFVSRWNGSSWQRLPGQYGSTTVRINTMAVFQDDLYIGGSFSSNTSRNLLRWNGSQWKPAPANPFLPVDVLCVYRDKLVLATRSSEIGSLPIRAVAAWDGTSWSDLGGGVDGDVYALSVLQDRLYVSALLDTPPGTPHVHRYLLTWDGARWQDPPSYVASTPVAMAEFQGDLYFGTSVMTDPSGGTISAGIGRWDGQAWSEFAPGFDRRINQLQADAHGLYAAGAFSRAGSSVRTSTDDGFARWDGSAWDFVPIGGERMTIHQGDIVATRAAAFPTYEVLRFDGSTTTRLGGLFDSWVSELFSSGADLIATGNFTAVDGVPASHVARWDGAAWRAMGAGFPSPAHSFLVFRGELIAAGDHWARRWNGSAWTAITGAPNGYVFDMTVYGDKLILAGHFDTVSLATTARSIATWNGTSWGRLGTGAQSLAGIHGTVTSLAIVGDDLVAAGEFDTAGGVPVSNIARWDGSAWHAMGSGANGPINSLAVYNDELILGGEFTVVDGRVSAYWGRWGCPPPPVHSDPMEEVLEIITPMLESRPRR